MTDYLQVAKSIESLNKKWFEKEFLLKVVVFEAFNNAIEHGSLPVFLSNESHNNTFIIRIKDSGPGFQYVPIHEDILTSPDTLQDRGRGLYIIHNVMDEVRFNEAGNEILLIKSVK